MLDDILQQLPDERSTRRLLSILDKLESNLNAQRKGNAAALASNAELKVLREENMSLRFKQRKAFERLDKLMVKLPDLFPELSDAPANESAAA